MAIIIFFCKRSTIKRVRYHCSGNCVLLQHPNDVLGVPFAVFHTSFHFAFAEKQKYFWQTIVPKLREEGQFSKKVCPSEWDGEKNVFEEMCRRIFILTFFTGGYVLIVSQSSVFRVRRYAKLLVLCKIMGCSICEIWRCVWLGVENIRAEKVCFVNFM